jgi:hypothetical protein
MTNTELVFLFLVSLPVLFSICFLVIFLFLIFSRLSK